MGLELFLFGVPGYRLDGGDVRPLKGQRSPQLIALLALAPGYAVTRKRLQQELWSTSGDDVRKALSWLREHHPGLGPWVREQGVEVRLEFRIGDRANEPEVDVLHFADLVREGRFEQAIVVARGPFLASIPDNASGWIKRTRRHRHSEVALAYRELALENWRAGDRERAIQLAERRLEWSPDDAAATKELALLLAHQGRRNDARKLLTQLLNQRIIDAPADLLLITKTLDDITDGKPSNIPEPREQIARPKPDAPSSYKVFNVGFPRNHHFTGRTDALEALRASLLSSGPVAVAQAISGEGGIGKTQLAVEYAYRYTTNYDVVWWFGAEQAADLPQQMGDLALRLGLTQDLGVGDSLTLRVALAREWLANHGRWLLIFDNAEDPTALGKILPNGAGHILITSRRQHWPGWAEVQLLDTFSLNAGTSFLLARTGADDSEAARELAALTGGLPLALEQAAAYVAEHKLSLAKYLELYRRRADELWKRGQPAFYEHTVATTWLLAFEDISTTLPAAVDMLKTCAFLAAEGIPRSLFDFARDGALPTLADELVRADAVALLRRHSLARVTADGRMLTVHRLLAQQVRDQMTGDERARLLDELALLLMLGTSACTRRSERHFQQAQDMLQQVRAFARRAQLISPSGCIFLRGALFLGVSVMRRG